MKKYLLPAGGNAYKANLHCHSTITDGNLTIQQIKALYKANGYSIVAFTDHDVFLPHRELRDPDFLPLHGYEVEIDKWLGPGIDPLTCHLCFVCLDESNDTPVCWHRTKYLIGGADRSAHLVRNDPDLPDFEREYTPECINRMIRLAREKNFFVTYNHPTFSEEHYPQYSRYEGMNAMEISNSLGALTHPEYNARVYDDMLSLGKRLYCLYTDDNHNVYAPGTVRWDSCKNYVMIYAERLDYPSIAAALLSGSFYSSQGPEIHSLTFEDGILKIECSKARRIQFTTGRRRGDVAEGCSAEFAVQREDKYVRITLVDDQGMLADTNAYFTDDLFQ